LREGRERGEKGKREGGEREIQIFLLTAPILDPGKVGERGRGKERRKRQGRERREKVRLLSQVRIS
jgi:hypothetical protein